MNWHTRYTQQASWTRDLRDYIFNKAGLNPSYRILEVGCGTGAILSSFSTFPIVYGLDIDHRNLRDCRIHAPNAVLVEADVKTLPYPDESFDITYSHFLLLWVGDPLRALLEMKRVTRPSGYVIAFAEPDYLNRVDAPKELVQLGKWQTESLIRQGADPGIGSRLAELFHEAGIHIIETGTIQGQVNEAPPDEWKLEWDVIESDLAGWVPDADIQKMKLVDKRAREQKTRVMHVPTHFAWGNK